MKLRLLVLVALLLAFAPAAMAQGPQLPDVQLFGFDKPTNVTNRIYVSAVLRDGTGNAIGKVLAGSATINNSRNVAALRVSATGLSPNTSYTLVIDGNVVGSATTNARGVLKMKFASPTKGRVQPLPESVLPISAVRTATLFDTASQSAVATGNFAVTR